jgi:hypothetical protein
MNQQPMNLVSYKRAISEHAIIYNRFNNCSLNIDVKKNNSINNSIINREFTISFDYDNSKFRYVFDDKYPFYPPKLFINDWSYIKILSINNSTIRDLIQEKSNKQCLCCETLLCNLKWSPAIKVDKIIDEYILNKKIIIYCINKKKLLELNTEINNLFPFEIIEKIASYF